MPANYGLLPQRREYLQHLATLCRKHGALLIFDEVISGFRVGFQGCAGLYGFEPDLVTYGKVIGGGFPVGAYGGKREYMEQVAPAGTGVPGRHAVRESGGDVRRTRHARAACGRQALCAARDAGRATVGRVSPALRGITLQRVGSVFWPILAESESPIRSLAAMRAVKAAPFGPVFHRLLDRGIYLAPSAYEVGFLSTAHTETHVDQLIAELRLALG